MVVTRAAQHHHLTVALMVSDEWAVNDARPVDNPQTSAVPPPAAASRASTENGRPHDPRGT